MREREDNQKRNSVAPAPFTAPLGTILSVLRLGRGLGREELSRQLNLNASYVARLERGDGASQTGTSTPFLRFVLSIELAPDTMISLRPWC